MIGFVTPYFLLFLSARLPGLALSQNQSVSVNLNNAYDNVSDHFLSVTIDSHAIRSNWYGLDFKSERLINMGRALAPAMLRIGGTAEEFLLFSEKEHKRHYDDFQSKITDDASEENFTMSTSQWDIINQYAQATGWEIIFGLNVFLRTALPEGDWNPTNAEQLMKYSTSKGYHVNWELGNEPHLFPKITNTTVISAEQLAKDFGILQSLLEKLNLKPNYVAGPDTTGGGDQYLDEFVKDVPPRAINALTWHHYYEGGATAVLPDFFNPEILDSFMDAANRILQIILHRKIIVELWLGETSSCFDGGAPVLSSSYIAGFMWLDKLGIAAIISHKRVFRQSFIASGYGLLDTNANPLPDFWLSVVYKKLVGSTVLNVQNSTKHGRYVRVYAHCAKTPLYPPGSVTLIILNVNTFDTSITLNDEPLASSSRDVYWLTPPGGAQNILSKQVTLNGKLLELVNNSTIPKLNPVQEDASQEIQLPKLSFGFYVFKDAQAKGCVAT